MYFFYSLNLKENYKISKKIWSTCILCLIQDIVIATGIIAIIYPFPLDRAQIRLHHCSYFEYFLKGTVNTISWYSSIIYAAGPMNRWDVSPVLKKGQWMKSTVYWKWTRLVKGENSRVQFSISKIIRHILFHLLTYHPAHSFKDLAL